MPSGPAWAAHEDPPSTLAAFLPSSAALCLSPTSASLYMQNQRLRADQSSVVVLGTSSDWLGCLSVTWYSREVVLPCVLWGMNWSSSSILKIHGVNDPFLDANQQDGKFYTQIRLLVKITALWMLKNGFMKEKRYRTVNVSVKVWCDRNICTEWLWFLQRPCGCDPGCNVQEPPNIKGGQENKLIQGQYQSTRVAYSKGQEVKAVARVQLGQIRNSWSSSNVGRENMGRAETGMDYLGGM